MPLDGNFLGVIPARGGSKAVPKKNVRELSGKPLIAHTILAARSSRSLERTIVSTDDLEIAEIARQWEGDVPFIRPRELSLDTTPTWPVLSHATAWIEEESGKHVDGVVLLQPTSPLRTADDIDGAVALYLELGADVVASATPSPYIPHFSMVETLPGSPWAIPSKSDSAFRLSRQRTPETWGLNGAIFVVSRRAVFEFDSHMDAERYAVYSMPAERSLDIDSEFDFEMADWLLSRDRAGLTV